MYQKEKKKKLQLLDLFSEITYYRIGLDELTRDRVVIKLWIYSETLLNT